MRSPLLWEGMIFASLSLSGNTQLYSELLKLLYNISDTMSKFSFKITEGIESIEQDFDGLSASLQ